ncbi:MAG: hypothetical protein IJ091_06930 [Oscillospiraceae bacterium]|nr:hypothetical protein [Oscillospiraceae bacterium]
MLVNALNAYHAERPAYWNYFANVELPYKGTTSNYIITNDDAIVFEKTQEQEQAYSIRQLIQYDLIFGKRYLEEYLY